MNNLDYKVNSYQVITQFCTHFNHFKRQSAIHSDELDTLLYIANSNTAVTPIKLAHYFNVSKPRITTILHKLQEQHYIEKKPSKKDGRSQVLIMTQQGTELLANLQNECYTIIDQMVEELGFGDFIQLTELIKRANEII